MDGLLVVDKPSGPTSHDVVERIRRILQERRIGHAGTLDPMASGVLPLLIGRATRLARFMSGEEKRYEATVRLGFATDTCDAMGVPIRSAWIGPWPTATESSEHWHPSAVQFMQQPPAYSAKKMGGMRSYHVARARARAGKVGASPADAADETNEAPGSRLPAPAAVTAFAIEVTQVNADRVRLDLACSSGFYVRSLAHDLGQSLGVGGHLAALRRTATSGVTLLDAACMDDLQVGAPDGARRRIIPLERLLPTLPGIELTETGSDHVAQGRDVGPPDARSGFPLDPTASGPYRLISAEGLLLGIAERAKSPELLHPAVVLV